MSKRKQKEKIQQLNTAIDNNYTLPEEEKKYWRENAAKLSPIALDSIIADINETNEYVNQCLRAALENDPKGEHLNNLKTIVNKTKKETRSLEEGTQQPNAEEFLENQMNQL